MMLKEITKMGDGKFRCFEIFDDKGIYIGLIHGHVTINDTDHLTLHQAFVTFWKDSIKMGRTEK